MCADFDKGTLCLSSAVLRNISASAPMWSLQMIRSSGMTLTFTVYHTGICGAFMHFKTQNLISLTCSKELLYGYACMEKERSWMVILCLYMIICDCMWEAWERKNSNKSVITPHSCHKALHMILYMLFLWSVCITLSNRLTVNVQSMTILIINWCVDCFVAFSRFLCMQQLNYFHLFCAIPPNQTSSKIAYFFFNALHMDCCSNFDGFVITANVAQCNVRSGKNHPKW